ncbi:MAG TPA: heme-degrading domain-containing protein [Chthoniobacterales bacterium]|nr:heme-degrading domain-containing protein [Chthoniobacterales bacterium]
MDLSRDLERIEHQERELTLAKFDLEVAWRLGQRLRELAAERRLPVVIDIRYFGQPLFYSALPGSVPDNAEWVRRKSNTVARFHRSSYAVGLMLKQAQTTLLERYALPVADFAAHGGSFPIHVKGIAVIGAVTVSGLPQRADHELVVEALCLELGQAYGSLALPKGEGQ